MKIIISEDRIDFEGEVNFANAVNGLFTALYNIMKTTASAETSHPGLKDKIYDTVNDAASAVLAQYDPEREVHPDLTVEAIRLAEDVVLQKQLLEMPEADRSLRLERALRGIYEKQRNILAKQGYSPAISEIEREEAEKADKIVADAEARYEQLGMSYTEAN